MMTSFDDWQFFSGSIYQSTKGKPWEVLSGPEKEGSAFCSALQTTWQELVVLAVAEVLWASSGAEGFTAAALTAHFEPPRAVSRELAALEKKGLVVLCPSGQNHATVWFDFGQEYYEALGHRLAYYCL